MLAEFAAAAANLSKGIDEAKDEDEAEDEITTSAFIWKMESILKESHSNMFTYYSSRLLDRHKHFTWTGPKVEIHPRSPDILSIIPLATLGERLDFPGCQIYVENLDPEPPLLPEVPPLLGKRRDQADDANPSHKQPLKRKRLL